MLKKEIKISDVVDVLECDSGLISNQSSDFSSNYSNLC